MELPIKFIKIRLSFWGSVLNSLGIDSSIEEIYFIFLV